MNKSNAVETLTPTQRVERTQDRQEKRVFFMILLGFLSVSSGVMIYFGARALTGLAARPNASLNEGVASISSMLFGNSEDAEDEAGKLSKPNPFEEPKAFFNDTFGSSSLPGGATAGSGLAGGAGAAGGKAGVPFAGEAGKNNAAGGKLGGALSGIPSGSGGSKSAGSLSGNSSASKNGSGFNIGAPGSRTLDQKAQGRGTLSALNNAANTLYKSALSNSAQDKRAAGALVYDGGDKRKSGAEAQFSGAMVKLDNVDSSATDLKDHNPGSLTVPEVGKPVSDMAATKEAMNAAVKDALKKALDPTSGGVNSAMSGATSSMSDTVQKADSSNGGNSATNYELPGPVLNDLDKFRMGSSSDPTKCDPADTAVVVCQSAGNCTATFPSDGFQVKVVDGKLAQAVVPNGQTINLVDGKLPEGYSYADGTLGANAKDSTATQ